MNFLVKKSALAKGSEEAIFGQQNVQDFIDLTRAVAARQTVTTTINKRSSMSRFLILLTICALSLLVLGLDDQETVLLEVPMESFVTDFGTTNNLLELQLPSYITLNNGQRSKVQHTLVPMILYTNSPNSRVPTLDSLF